MTICLTYFLFSYVTQAVPEVSTSYLAGTISTVEKTHLIRLQRKNL